MSKQGLEKTTQFIQDISEDKEFEKYIVGQFDKYTVFVISNDGPYFYIEYLAESEWDDILYRFSLVKSEFDGLGEFEEWEELEKFLEENWIKIIFQWNTANNGAIENKGVIKYR